MIRASLVDAATMGRLISRSLKALAFITDHPRTAFALGILTAFGADHEVRINRGALRRRQLAVEVFRKAIGIGIGGHDWSDSPTREARPR